MDLTELTKAFSGLSEANRPIRLRLSQGQQVLDGILLIEAANLQNSALFDEVKGSDDDLNLPAACAAKRARRAQSRGFRDTATGQNGAVCSISAQAGAPYRFCSRNYGIESSHERATATGTPSKGQHRVAA